MKYFLTETFTFILVFIITSVILLATHGAISLWMCLVGTVAVYINVLLYNSVKWVIQKMFKKFR